MQQRYRRKAVSSIVRRKRFSPFMLIGLSVPVVLTLIVSTVFILPRLGSHAAAVNGGCTLISPSNPLSAQALATAHPLLATGPANGACPASHKLQAAFRQGARLR